jgi:hypothetical protein
MTTITTESAAPGADGARCGPQTRLIVLAALLVSVLAIAALTSDLADWQPVSLVLALTAVMIGSELASTWARKVRMSAGLMVQTPIVALLGPAPAALAGALSMGIDGRVKVPAEGTLLNMVVFALIGLVGGLLCRAQCWTSTATTEPDRTVGPSRRRLRRARGQRRRRRHRHVGCGRCCAGRTPGSGHGSQARRGRRRCSGHRNSPRRAHTLARESADRNPCLTQEWPRVLNPRGHSLDVCSITSWTLPA